MKEAIQKSERKVKYISILGRIIVAFLGSLMIIMTNEPRSFWVLLSESAFWLNLLCLSFVTFLFFTLIFLITRDLDKKLPWITERKKRYLAQGLLGVVLPIMLVYLLASYYYSLNGLSEAKFNFFIAEWYIIILLFIILNIFYSSHFLAQFINLFLESDYNAKTTVHVLEKWRVKKGANTSQLCESEVKLFHCTDKLNYGVISNLLRYEINESLEKIYNRLDQKQFRKISRQVIISRKVIESYKSGTSNTLILKLNFEYDYEITVSQGEVQEFIIWFDGKKI